MSNLLIIGADNKIARAVRENLQYDPDDHTTLFVRYQSAINNEIKESDRVIEGKVTDLHVLKMAMHDQDIIYADINRNLADAANTIIEAMHGEHVKRLIFATTSGIYDQLPETYGEWDKQQIDAAAADFYQAAKLIRTSDLDYTLVRPFWLHRSLKQDENMAMNAEPFKPTDLSQDHVVKVITDLIQDPDKYQHTSISIDKD